MQPDGQPAAAAAAIAASNAASSSPAAAAATPRSSDQDHQQQQHAASLQPSPSSSSQAGSIGNGTAAAGTTPADASSPFAFSEEGYAVDPIAFHRALLADSAKVAAIRSEMPADVSSVLLAEPHALDVDAFQALLHKVYLTEKARIERFRGPGSWAERSIDALRASAPVPRDTVQVYEQLRKAGLQYGPAFRLLRNIHVPYVPKQEQQAQ